MLTEVYPRLFVGNLQDAKDFKGIVCCVFEKGFIPDGNGGSLEDNIRPDALDFPIFNDQLAEFDIVQLELLSRFVKRTLKNYSDTNILIHCIAGWERSPFALAYVLWRNFNDKFTTLPYAYSYIKSVHKETKFVSNWIPKWWKDIYFEKEDLNSYENY